jgi:hypothetical protein
MKALS